MRLAIIGSRQCRGLTLQQVLEQIPPDCSEIISGGAAGVDQLAREAAQSLGLPFREILPDYPAFGKLAPIIRNDAIVQSADMVLAFWDYHSKGTRDALLKGLKRDKPVKIIMLPEPFSQRHEK